MSNEINLNDIYSTIKVNKAIMDYFDNLERLESSLGNIDREFFGLDKSDNLGYLYGFRPSLVTKGSDTNMILVELYNKQYYLRTCVRIDFLGLKYADFHVKYLAMKNTKILKEVEEAISSLNNKLKLSNISLEVLLKNNSW